MILPLLIIPFRAATAWCASTGDGYCVDPTLLWSTSNASNVTLHINLSCITASSVQWTIASLAYLANAILVFEYLDPFRYMCTTVLRTKLCRRHMACMVVHCADSPLTEAWVFMWEYSMRLLQEICANSQWYFWLSFTSLLDPFIWPWGLGCMLMWQLEQSHQKCSSSVCRPCELYRYVAHVFMYSNCSHTLCRYPWHVVFTGLRSLVEARGVLRGNYFANNDDGQYIGYTWVLSVCTINDMHASGRSPHLCETPYSSCTFPPHPPQVVLYCLVHDLPVRYDCGPAQCADCPDE